jgi:GNAT superfamily N-acetyltransferase
MDAAVHPSFLVSALGHPSLSGAIERFAGELRAERRSFGQRGLAARKPAPALIRRLLEPTPGPHLAAVVDGAVIGVARIDASAPTGPELLIAVVESWRGQGVASALGAQVVARAASQGYHRILLHTAVRAPQVRALGAALGFDFVEIDRGRVDLVWRQAPEARTA